MFNKKVNSEDEVKIFFAYKNCRKKKNYTNIAFSQVNYKFVLHFSECTWIRYQKVSISELLGDETAAVLVLVSLHF